MPETLAQSLHRHDRDRYLTTLFAPAERRADLIALYAFNFEVAKTREIVHEPLLGRIRLQWWRESIDAIYRGLPLRKHEVVEPLAAAIRRHDLTRYHFDRLIDAREADLDEEPPASLDALELYAEDTAARLVRLALEILDTRDEAAGEAGRQRFLELKSSTALFQIVEQLAERAREHLAAARAAQAAIPRRALTALLIGTLADTHLGRIARAGYDPFAPDLARPDTLASWRLAMAWLTRQI